MGPRHDCTWVFCTSFGVDHDSELIEPQACCHLPVTRTSATPHTHGHVANKSWPCLSHVDTAHEYLCDLFLCCVVCIASVCEMRRGAPHSHISQPHMLSLCNHAHHAGTMAPLHSMFLFVATVQIYAACASAAPAPPGPPCNNWPNTCPGTVPRGKQVGVLNF